MSTSVARVPEALAFRNTLRWQAFEKGLLVAVLLDLALGGNGYLILIDGFRLREIFYVLCMAWLCLRLVLIDPVRIDATIVGVTIFFVAVTALDVVLGYAGGSQSSAIVAELKPLSYFPMLLFFVVAIRTRQDLSLVARILTACGLLVGLIYLMTLLAAAIGLISYVRVFQFLHKSDEFIFRHNPNGPFIGFFYKGAFYVCIAAIFLLFDPFRKTKLIACVPVIAMGMTLTRGLCGALLASILLGIAMSRNWRRAAVLAGHAVLLMSVLFMAIRSERALLIASGDLYSGEPVERPSLATRPATVAEPGKSPSRESAAPRVVEKRRLTAEEIKKNYPQETARPGDSQRMDDIGFVAKNTTLLTALVGHGLGAPIGNRNRIEMNYLEVFYKQGLLGLALWAALFAYSFHLYLRVPGETKQFAAVFLVSSFFVAVATASNTFLTGSIGMAVVFIAMAGLLVLSRERPHPMLAKDWYGLHRRDTPGGS
jgi:hypothetical protein